MKASSESGLWAIVISRISAAVVDNEFSGVAQFYSRGNRRYQVFTAPAANITLTTSAKMNQYRPSAIACRKECVNAYSQPRPQIKSKTSPAVEASAAPAKLCFHRAKMYPVNAATTG